MSSSIEEALGSVEEMFDGDRKRRVVLPVSCYNMNIELEETGVSQLNDSGEVLDGVETPDGEAIPKGGSPYAQLMLTVADGPFEGEGFSSRIYLTPGMGKYIGFSLNACRSISQKPTNEEAYKNFGFTFENGWTSDQVQKAFRFYFYNLSPEQRLDFMTQWARIPEWDGKSAVVKVGHEEVRRQGDDGKEYDITFNRIKGFWSSNDKKKGAAFVRKSCHPFQQTKKVEMDLGS